MYRLRDRDGRVNYIDDELGVSCAIMNGWEAGLVQTPDLLELNHEEAVSKAVRQPKYGWPLREIVRRRGGKTACVLVSDATRAVPTARLFRYVAEELSASGISEENVRVFVALGVHREATESEMKLILGDYYGRVSIENHTPYDQENLVYLGETTRGTPVWVNKRAVVCDIHVQIGKVEPHEFAGFSGGRKSVLPGVSSEKTIKVNHRPEMILAQGAGIGKLDGNPVHEDMLEAANLFRIDFSVNCILNNQLKLAAVFAGKLRESHEAAVRNVRERLGVRIQRPDILVTTPGKPLDIDFYQSVKALIALTEVLDERTVVILYCGCPEGVNSPDMLNGFKSSENLEEAVAYTINHYEVQSDHVILLAKILRKKVKVIVCCPSISDEEIREMFMEPCPTLEAALKRAEELCKKERGQILFYPKPQTGLPVLR